MPGPSAASLALYRAALRDVDTLAQRDLLVAWRQFDHNDAEAARDALMDVLPGLIGNYHLAAAAVAADWYDVVRDEVGTPGSFTAIVPDEPDRGRAQALARWGVAPLFSANPDPATALTKVAGGLQRTVHDGARQTITRSSLSDPVRVGWRRVTSPDACEEFCKKLAARGAVYSKETADFASHDHCQCDAAPEFGTERRRARTYTRSTRFRDEEARRRANRALRNY